MIFFSRIDSDVCVARPISTTCFSLEITPPPPPPSPFTIVNPHTLSFYVCQDDSTADWFASLDQALGFNTRMVQRVRSPRDRACVSVCLVCVAVCVFACVCASVCMCCGYLTV